MIGRLAFRSLTAHPVRSAVLAAGFGAGVAVMAILLGVAAIVLQQAQSPALVGGGDVLIRMNRSVPARMVLTGTLQSSGLQPQIRTASPFHTASVFLLHDGQVSAIEARGGIPSLERALGDPETTQVEDWRDTDADVAWTNESPSRVLRQIDRFHEVPDVPRWADSWAEWLYFNGRAGDARFYLTFMVGPRKDEGQNGSSGQRAAGVRLQLERNGRLESFTGGTGISEADALRAPDLTIGNSRVTLEDLTYRIDLDLADARGRRVRGTLRITATAGKLVPPIEISGANGWRTGYVVPVMSGALDGTLDVNGTTVSLQGGSGYHDHNWGFWEGVSWQWGQAQAADGDLSLLYGRVFAPPEAADPDRIPGFVGVLGPDGPLGYATDVKIVEQNDANGQPRTISITGRGPSFNLTTRFDVASAVTTRSQQGALAGQLDFLQMRGQYTVSGTVGTRQIDFTAAGAAETFRGRN